MLILCAGCTRHEVVSSAPATPSATPQFLRPKISQPETAVKNKDKELQKILHWFEQMDAIFREALWVIRKEKAPQGKSIFGKMQRALLIEMKQKLSNKSLFKCDVYSMTRNKAALGEVPQDAEVMHQCNTKESFIKIGNWSHPKANELNIHFRGGNLEEVLGFATSILSPQISCQLKSNDHDIIENFSCDGLMIDYNPAKNQVLRFNRFEYQRSLNNMLYMKAEVLENLDPVRKIEVEVPLEGKITVTETVLQAPEYLAKQVPAPPAPKPSPSISPPDIAPAPTTPDAISAEDIYHDRNGQEIDRQETPESRGIRQPKPIQAKTPQEVANPQEGHSESSDQEPPDPGQIQQKEPEIPRENNTR
ncbi:MAG: hypothetical protein ACXWRA_14350 [Pseudobdellovibrionaceae bacterium]